MLKRAGADRELRGVLVQRDNGDLEKGRRENGNGIGRGGGGRY